MCVFFVIKCQYQQNWEFLKITTTLPRATVSTFFLFYINRLTHCPLRDYEGHMTQPRKSVHITRFLGRGADDAKAIGYAAAGERRGLI